MELLAELRSPNFIEGLFHWLRLCCAEFSAFRRSIYPYQKITAETPRTSTADCVPTLSGNIRSLRSRYCTIAIGNETIHTIGAHKLKMRVLISFTSDDTSGHLHSHSILQVALLLLRLRYRPLSRRARRTIRSSATQRNQFGEQYP
jgi:hypothetical protein